MRLSAILSVLVLCAATTAPVLAQVNSAVLFDPDLTVGAGASIVAAFGESVARAEDAVVPARLFSERGISRRSANIAYRFLKFVYFDQPQEQWLVVVNHEVFGHGARLRERFDGRIGYRIDAPVPYGDGGGSTSFTFGREPTVYELQAVTAGGMEADAVAARLTAHRAFSARRLRSRDAIRYLAFELDTLSYVLGTGDDPEEPGHDVSDFLQTYNAVAAAAGASPLTPREARREVLFALANPMLGYAAYSIGRYVWDGSRDVPVWAPEIGGVRWLPMVRYQLTPYGTEWSVMNELDGRIRPTQVEVRFGRAVNGTPWGVGVRQRRITSWRSWRLDLAVDVWRQPWMADDEISRGLRLGAELKGRLERPLKAAWFGSAPLTLVADLGVKFSGFVPGEPLRSGVVVRAGVGLPFEWE
jgi:hypothetical protein